MRQADEKAQFTCLTCCPLPYSGRGWPQSCVGVLSGFPEALRPVLVTPRTRVAVPQPVRVVSALGPPLSALPWRYVSEMGGRMLERRFRKLIDQADAATTVAYFWPGASLELVEHAKARGLLTVREMINTFQGTAKVILDEAYESLGLRPGHTITDARVDEEQRELSLYDHVFASNARCEDSLVKAGVSRDRIVPTSFGWFPERFASGEARSVKRDGGDGIKVLFVGTIGVRKGVPQLLEAWEKAQLAGELTLVGQVEPAIAPLLERAARKSRVTVVPYTSDVGSYYRSHDVFAFPTLEEGGPQVTLEAAGCGLPVVTTSMGATRLVKNGVNGVVVPEGDAIELASALTLLATDAGLRRRLAARAAVDAQKFTYRNVGAQRAEALLRILQPARVVETASHA